MRPVSWLSKWQGNGPRLASMALAILLGIEMARGFMTLLGGGPAHSVMPTTSHSVATARNVGVDIQGVIGSHLFGVAAAELAAEPGNAPQSTANLVLAGTIATDDPILGMAIVSDGAPSKVYSVGDRIGGASLHAVYLDRVILDRGGSLETLLLPRLLLSGNQTLPKTANDAPHVATAVDNLRQMAHSDAGALSPAPAAGPPMLPVPAGPSPLPFTPARPPPMPAPGGDNSTEY